MHFSEIFRGEHAPGPPLQKLPPMAVALSATEKNHLHFHRIAGGELESEAK